MRFTERELTAALTVTALVAVALTFVAEPAYPEPPEDLNPAGPRIHSDGRWCRQLVPHLMAKSRRLATAPAVTP